jgi:hypothetical protein
VHAHGQLHSLGRRSGGASAFGRSSLHRGAVPCHVVPRPLRLRQMDHTGGLRPEESPRPQRLRGLHPLFAQDAAALSIGCAAWCVLTDAKPQERRGPRLVAGAEPSSAGVSVARLLRETAHLVRSVGLHGQSRPGASTNGRSVDRSFDGGVWAWSRHSVAGAAPRLDPVVHIAGTYPNEASDAHAGKDASLCGSIQP